MSGLCCHVCGPTLCTFSFAWLVDWLVWANLSVCTMSYTCMFVPKFQKWWIVRGLNLSLPNKLNFHSPNLAPASSARSPLPIQPCLRRRPLLAAAKNPTFLLARWSYLPGEGAWLVRSVRRMWTPWRNWSTRTSSPPIRSRSWSNTAPTTTNRLVSADINPRICLLEVNPRNCSLVIPHYSYRQSYCSPFFWLIVWLSVLGFANLDEWIMCIPFYACLSYNQSFRKPIQRKNNLLRAFDIMYNSLAWDCFSSNTRLRIWKNGRTTYSWGKLSEIKYSSGSWLQRLCTGITVAINARSAGKRTSIPKPQQLQLTERGGILRQDLLSSPTNWGGWRPKSI